MKLQYLVLSIAFTFLSVCSFAAAKTDTIKVYGNCESCKNRIEKAAKEAGATAADWSEDTKLLVVTYDDAQTTNLKIQQKIASVGHDTQDVKAPEGSYNKLPGCCKYERKTAAQTSGEKAGTGVNCCGDKEQCANMKDCCTSADMHCCTKDATTKAACCADESCTRS